MSAHGVAIRNAGDADMAAIQAIYAHHVMNGLATFEEIAPSVGEMTERRAAMLASGLPYIVAVEQDRVAGYAYASRYRQRSAYRYALEDSVYVAVGLEGRGIGGALLSALIARCEKGPWRQMIAVIGDSGNTASIVLHERRGFRHVGVLRSAGFKFGRWVDTVLMQRPLGQGDDTLPGD